MFIESIRAEGGRMWHTHYHYRRIVDSVGKEAAPGVMETISQLGEGLPSERSKLRIVYDARGVQDHSISPYRVPAIRTLRLVTDDEVGYSLKYLDRQRLNDLFSSRQACDDILICRNGELTDTLFCNIVLQLKGGELVTPLRPLLAGTTRQRLLDEGVISARPLTPHDLQNSECLRLINAMIGLEDDLKIEIKNII